MKTTNKIVSVEEYTLRVPDVCFVVTREGNNVKRGRIPIVKIQLTGVEHMCARTVL